MKKRLPEIIRGAGTSLTLARASSAILDNGETVSVTDADYPMTYFREKDGKTCLRVIDDKTTDRKLPRNVEFEYLRNEIR